MNRRAFTLIELMIVVAILGIALCDLYPSIETMWRQNRRERDNMRDTGALTRAYALIKAELRQCADVSYADENGVLFADDRSIKIFDAGKTVVIGKKVIKFAGRARIWGFEKIDARTFSSEVHIGNDDIRVVWRTGADNE